MLLEATMVVATLCWSAHAQAAYVPPSGAAVSVASQDLDGPSSGEDMVGKPEKRLLKYFLPGSQAWLSGVEGLYPTRQEGTKRGYSDRNYLRFGRSDEDKRGPSRNFLRFGRSGLGDYSSSSGDEELIDSVEKRGRNFLRFGRDPSRNFLRFGRSDMEEFGLAGGPVEFPSGVQDELNDLEFPIDEKRDGHSTYIRYLKGNRDFPRFGRGDRNFLRFGRSVDRQKSSMSFENCDEEPKTHDVTSTPSPTPVQPMTRTKQQAATHSIASSDSDKTTSHRMKRNVSRVYGYITLPTHTRDINPEEDAINVAYSDEPQVVDKRGYNKGFLRFGRDRNFLRFGKRDVSGEYPTYSSISSSESSGSLLGERPARAHQRNFIRFG
ncbi:FMRFamide-related peptides type HF-4-like isoform X2 [Cherax quadricarinatus]